MQPSITNVQDLVTQTRLEKRRIVWALFFVTLISFVIIVALANNQAKVLDDEHLIRKCRKRLRSISLQPTISNNRNDDSDFLYENGTYDSP